MSAERVLPATSRYWLLLPILLACLLPGTAAAWNFTGHRLSACIAWDQLSASSRQHVVKLLRAHPDYAYWTHKAGNAAPERTAFIEASTWADRIRYDARFHDAEEPATPLLPGFPDMQRHSDWHYENRALAGHPGARDGDRQNNGQLEKQLILLTAALDAHRASATAVDAGSYALPWLIHLVADAHQPLHAVDAEAAWLAPEGDARVLDPSSPRRRIRSLHAFWDDLPGLSNLAGNKLDTACRALAARYPPPTPSNPRKWIDESLQIARSDGFPPDYEQTRRIGKAFYENAREIADRRIAAAGYRLADLLNRHLK
ncbi:MAG: S1/P1 nuclease [Propionivibrio sp.]